MKFSKPVLLIVLALLSGPLAAVDLMTVYRDAQQSNPQLAAAEATLRAKVGPIIFATYGDLRGWNTWASDAVVGDYYWEPESELLLSMDDLTWSINGVLSSVQEISTG